MLAHQAASSSWCTELIPHGAHSPWHSPFSGVAIYGGKAWQMQESSAKSLDAFSPELCQQWHLVAWLAPRSALTGGAWPELCEGLVGQSVSEEPPKILSPHSLFHSQRGRGQSQDFAQTLCPYPLCAVPSPGLVLHTFSRPVLRQDTSAPLNEFSSLNSLWLQVGQECEDCCVSGWRHPGSSQGRDRHRAVSRSPRPTQRAQAGPAARCLHD